MLRISLAVLVLLLLAPLGVWAAPAPTHLTAGFDETDQTNVNTASVTCSANCLCLATVGGTTSSGAAPDPTLTGATSGSWVKINSLGTGGSPEFKMFLYRTLSSSDQTAAINISFGSTTMNRIAWTVTKWCSVDTSGTDGSGAVVQNVTNSNNDVVVTCTLAAYSNSNNRPFGAFSYTQNFDGTPGSGFTELNDTPNAIALSTEWRDATDDTTVDYTRSGGSAASRCITLEIKNVAAAAGGSGRRLLLED